MSHINLYVPTTVTTMISIRSLSVSLALTLIILEGVSPAFGIFDCCKKYTEKRVKVSQVAMFEGYYYQDSAAVCDIDAIVFKVNTRPCGEPKRISLCADPNQKWVKSMISAMRKHSKMNKKQQKRKQRKLCKRMKKNYA